MSDVKGGRVAIAGAGVIGLSIGCVLAERGANVVIHDPAPLGDNASGVAAGMLAPASEAALDPASADHFALLRAARDLWPEFAQMVGAPPGALDRSGAVHVRPGGDGAELDRLAHSLVAAGAQIELVGRSELKRLQPELAAEIEVGVFTLDDWRIEPAAMLEALQRAFERRGGRVVRDRLDPDRPLDADVLVIAAGMDSAGFARLAPELAILSPIKGQILHLSSGPTGGPIVRAPGVYVAPQSAGAIAGATMEAGRNDRETDEARLGQLRDAASRLFPRFSEAPAKGFAGVRASTPDALPLVGPSARRGVLLATGVRRNGWLLAPLVAQMTAAHLAGEDPGPFAALMTPSRFAGG